MSEQSSLRNLLLQARGSRAVLCRLGAAGLVVGTWMPKDKAWRVAPGAGAPGDADTSAGAPPVSVAAGVEGTLVVFAAAGVFVCPVRLQQVEADGIELEPLGEVQRRQRRIHLRAPVYEPVRFRHGQELGELDALNQGLATGYVRDISSSGLGLMSPVELGVGARLRLIFQRAPWANLGALPGTVVRVRDLDAEFEYGVTLDSLDADTKRHLLHLLARIRIAHAVP